MVEPISLALLHAVAALDSVLTGDRDQARRIFADADDDVLAHVHAAAGDLRIITAETVAKRAASHTPPAVAAADGQTGVGEWDRMGETATGDSGGAT